MAVPVATSKPSTCNFRRCSTERATAARINLTDPPRPYGSEGTMSSKTKSRPTACSIYEYKHKCGVRSSSSLGVKSLNHLAWNLWSAYLHVQCSPNWRRPSPARRTHCWLYTSVCPSTSNQFCGASSAQMWSIMLATCIHCKRSRARQNLSEIWYIMNDLLWQNP